MVCVCMCGLCTHLPFATVWIDLEVIILSDVSQTEKVTFFVISVM